MKRFALASGGSGGHLAPAIAVGESLARSGCRPFILTTRKPVDRQLQEKYGGMMFREGAPQLGGKGFWGRSRFCWDMVRDTWRCARALEELECQGLLATGGFGSVPAVAGACGLGVEVHLHESNSRPGKVTRWCRPLSRLTWVTRLNEPGVGLSGPNIRRTGFPVRNELVLTERRQAKLDLGLQPEKPLVSVFGGSQGALALNRWAARESLGFARLGVQMICVSGQVAMEEGYDPESLRVIPFCADMAMLYSASDVMLTRAGAGTIAELAHCGVPALLVPYPYAADDHQRANADVFVRAGCAGMIDESQLTDARDWIMQMINHQGKRAKMIDALRAWDARNAVDALLGCLRTHVGGERRAV